MPTKDPATKDPDAKLDYTVDWSQWLPDGDTITAAEWEIPDGLTGSGQTIDGAKATIWLAGGELGKAYSATCRVTTAQGRIDDRTIHIRIADR